MRATLFLCLGLLTTSGAVAGPVPDYDFDWAEIGALGNRRPLLSEVPGFPDAAQYGSVNYHYRMTRTEVVTSQWLEFANAYVAHYDGSPTAFEMTGWWLSYDSSSGQYSMADGAALAPVETTWRMAARFTNWLSNGKSNDASAFENGAYDTSTFGRNPDATFTDQLEHTPGAAFWIPTYDEWVKGMHYDPNRYGQGEEGYWRYPHSSDSEPLSGLPDDGGETNAGLTWGQDGWFMDAGSYPDVQSPWGLLDGSGGAREWTETAFDSMYRFIDGSEFGEGNGFQVRDLIEQWSIAFPEGYYGFRIAGVIPAPWSGSPMIGGVSLLLRRKR